MVNVPFTITGDESKGLAAMQRVIVQQGKMLESVKKTNKELKKSTKNTSKTASATQNLASNVKGMIQSYVGLNAILTVVDKLGKRTEFLTNKTSSLFDNLVSLKSIGVNTAEATAVAKTQAQLFGVDPKESTAAFQKLTSISDSKVAGEELTFQAGRAKRAGIPFEAATAVIGVAFEQGIDAKTIIRQALAAGEKSGLSPAQLAEILPKTLPAASTVKGGSATILGVAAQLSATFTKVADLQTITKNFFKATTTGLEGTKKGKTFKELGITDVLDTLKTARIFKEKGIVSVQDLEKAGFGAEEERLAFASVIKGLDKARNISQFVLGKGEEKGLIEQVSKGIAAEPLIQTQQLIQNTDALKAVNDSFNLAANREALAKKETAEAFREGNAISKFVFTDAEGDLNSLGELGFAITDTLFGIRSDIQKTTEVNEQILNERRTDQNKNRNIN